MHSIAIYDVVINEDRRQRREFDEVAHQELMQSLMERGQLQPIIIDRETNELLAGERRYRAAQALGWDAIECKYLDDLDEGERMLVQYDENIRRSDLDWKSKALALHKYHTWMADNHGQTQAMTATHFNMSQKSFSEYLLVAKALLAEDEMVTDADTFSVARGIVERKRARQADVELDKYLGTSEDKPAPVESSDKPSQDTASTHGTAAVSSPAEAVAEGDDDVGVPFRHADFNEWAPKYTGPKFNLLHCDFPYGIDTDKHDSSAQGYGGYDDSEATYFQLLDTLEAAMDNVVASSAHLIFWFSMDFYQVTYDRLTAMGWRVNHFPLIWHKTNKSILPDPKRGPRRQYETAFLASRGDRLIVRATTNLKDHAATKEVHKSEKPREMLAHFMGMVCDETSYVLDPTMGSGNAIAVAEEFGAKAMGLEKDAEFLANATAHYKRNLTS